MTSNMKTEKKEFIKWFLHNHNLKKREAVWILNNLISNDELFEQVHFVENAKNYPRGLIISSTDSVGAALHYYKDEKLITDSEKIFHDIRHVDGVPIYIQLNFDSRKPNTDYLNLLEISPHELRIASLSEAEQNYVEEIIGENTLFFQKSYLYQQIDAALDAHNEARFIELSNSLQKLG